MPGLVDTSITQPETEAVSSLREDEGQNDEYLTSQLPLLQKTSAYLEIGRDPKAYRLLAIAGTEAQ